MALDGTQELEIFHGEVAPQSKGGIERRSAVALGEDKPVTVFPGGVGRVDFHLFEVEDGESIQAAERSAGMAGLCFMHRVNGKKAGFVGLALQAKIFIHKHLPRLFKELEIL